MTDINQYIVQNEVIPEESNLIIQQEQQSLSEEESIPNILHLNGKQLPEPLHISDSEDDVTEELSNTLEQSSHHSTSLEATSEESNIPQVSETSSISSIEHLPIPHSNTLTEEEQQQTTLSTILEGVNDVTITNTPELDLAEETAVDISEQSTTMAGQRCSNIILQQSTSTPTSIASTSTNTPILTPQQSTPTSGSGNRGRSVSSVNQSTTSSGLLPRSQRVWEMDRQASECRRCHRRFNFLIRRHHCRRCGQIVCDKCSSHRIRLPAEELIEDPMISQSQYPLIASQSQRVCDACYREPIRRSSDSHQRKNQRNNSSMAYSASQMRRTDSSQSLMIDCPVCGQSFLGMPKNQQEKHLQQCLNVDSPPVQAPRYIVYKLSEDSTQIGDECPICLEEFDEGSKVSRMICLCSYHQNCLASWLERGKGCPVHYDALLHDQ